jgi:DNA-binding PadR family transcriptional regulator
VLGAGPLYGYAIMQAVEEESGGTLRPRIGSLYRVLGRLVDTGLVQEADAPEDIGDEAHPGRERRYYRLSAAGGTVLRKELARLQSVIGLARERDLLPGRPSR